MAAQFLIGADPEVFISDKATGKFICAHDLIPGTKYEPYKVPYGAVQVDGMALEFNIKPAASAKGFKRNIKAVYNQLGRMVPQYNLRPVPVAEFDDDYFAACPEAAKELGCEPDYNAYTENVNPRPNGQVTFRTASGHIHIGWLKPEEFRKDPRGRMHMTDCIHVVKALDNVLYPLSLEWDKDEKRRELYGKPGAFRPKPYGVEYRVLSNAWLQSDELIERVYRLTVGTLVELTQGIGHVGRYLDARGNRMRSLEAYKQQYARYTERLERKAA